MVAIQPLIAQVSYKASRDNIQCISMNVCVCVCVVILAVCFPLPSPPEDEKILKYFKKHCSNCTVPYSLDGTCIGRAAALSVTSNYSILTVIVCLLSIVCYWGL